MEICLINPPLSVNEFPHLALPLLKGYLSERNIRCVVRDYNVEIMDTIITERMERVQKYFYDRGRNISLNEITREYNNARKVFLQKDKIGKEDRAQKLINTYLRIAGQNIFEDCFRPDSLEKIKEAYNNTDVLSDKNKIIRFLRDTIIPYFQRNPYKIIGISVPFTSQIYYALLLGREIKKILPECRIAMGGPQISLFWKLIIDYEPFRLAFDVLVYGMGEVALEEYVRAVYTNKNLKEVHNLIYVREDNEICINKEKVIQRMEEIALPDFSDLPLDKYIFPKLPYQMSRGCYWGKCVFCSYRDDKSYISRTTESVTENLKTLEKKYGIHIFQFIDDAIHPHVLRQLADTLLKQEMKIRYDAYLRLDAGFTEELCRLLAKSGLKNVLFGFESANQRMLNLMRKGNSPDNMLRVLKNMKKAGIQNILSCLIGFPTETREEAWESIQFLKTNREWYYWVYIVHFGLISDMCQNAEIYGVYDVDYKNLIRYDDSGFTALGYPYKVSSGMTVEEAFEVIRQGRKELGITIFKDNFFS